MSGAGMPAGASGVAQSVRALAEADFGALAGRFAGAGFALALPAPGILQIRSARADDAGERASVLVSVGVHGDETGPIEVLAHVLDALSLQPHALAVELMVCVGNPRAIRAGRRFIDADLNRMFRLERGALAGTLEAARADVLSCATAAFFGAAGPRRWHLDLHAAIRPSLYPTFAVVPDLIEAQDKAALIGWLGQAAIGAIIINPAPAATYSHWSARHCGAGAATLELGRVGTLGRNDLSLFAGVGAALGGLLRGIAPAAAQGAPHMFLVAQEIVKSSADFRMAFGRATPNFTALPAGAVIATEGARVYTVGAAEELVVFPNPDVGTGLRAALLVVRLP